MKQGFPTHRCSRDLLANSIVFGKYFLNLLEVDKLELMVIYQHCYHHRRNQHFVNCSGLDSLVRVTRAALFTMGSKLIDPYPHSSYGKSLFSIKSSVIFRMKTASKGCASDLPTRLIHSHRAKHAVPKHSLRNYSVTVIRAAYCFRITGEEHFDAWKY